MALLGYTNYSDDAKKRQQVFWRRCWGTIVVIVSKPSSPVYPCVLSSKEKKTYVTPFCFLSSHEAYHSKKNSIIF
jgi:hypothetical protein